MLDVLRSIKQELERLAKTSPEKFDTTLSERLQMYFFPASSVDGSLSASLMPKVAKKTVDIGHEMEYMLATGNLRSRSGLGLQQV